MEKFEEDLERLKNKINSMTLSDEFKENLSKKLEIEYNRTTTKKRFFISKQIVAVCACCILFTSCAFAGSIGNVITNLFTNTFKEMELAIENGEMKQIDMDYIEKDGVSIKIDYAMVKDDSLYLVFNVLSEEEFNKAKLMEYQIYDDGKNIVYNNIDYEYERIEESNKIKRLSKKNLIIFVQLKNLGNYNITNIDIKKIILKNMDDTKIIENIWNFNI